MNILSFDAGGTKINYAVIDENGKILSEVTKIETPREITELRNTFKKIIFENKDTDAVSFATAGAVNLENTRVMSSTPNMPKGYTDTDFQFLSDKPVFVENDANAAAVAEYKVGAAKGFENNMTVTLGTGVGCGIIINGKLLRGKSGRAGEVGSMKLYPDKRRLCNCGNYDCFESYTSGTGLTRTFNEEYFKKYGKHENLTSYDLINGFKSGDELCKNVMNTWHEQLIAGFVSLNNIFDTEIIVISGGMGEFADIERLEAEVNRQTVCSPLKIVHAKAGNHSGMIGAAICAGEKFNR